MIISYEVPTGSQTKFVASYDDQENVVSFGDYYKSAEGWLPSSSPVVLDTPDRLEAVRQVLRYLTEPLKTPVYTAILDPENGGNHQIEV
jgi:hypothetical protein